MISWGNSGNRASLRGRRVRDRMRRRRIVHRIVLLCVCGGLMAGVWYGARIKALTITTVEVSGGTTIDLDMVEQEAQSALEGSYFLFIPKRFSYTYPRDAIVSAVKRLPRVAQATVTRTTPTALSIALIEHTPYALWCDTIASTTATSGDCLFISEEGFAFRDAPSLVGSTFLRYTTESRKPEIGSTLASLHYMQATKEFARALMLQHGLYVHSIVETKDRDIIYRLRGGGELLVAKDADVREALANLDAIFTSAEFKHLALGNFVYIDLRFGSKAFVKEFADMPQIESEETEMEQATATTTGAME